MLNVVLSIFLSFSILSGAQSIVDVSMHNRNEYTNYGYIYDGNIMFEEPNISFKSIEVSRWVSWLGARSQDICITDYEYIGVQNIQQITPYYNAETLTNFVIRETFTTVTSSTVSTTKKLSSEIVTGLQAQAGISGVGISQGLEVKSVYEIEHTTTYTTTKSTELSIEFEVKREVVDNKTFALCYAAPVYKLTGKTWQVDHPWWGDIVVKDSTTEITAYLTLTPFITVVFYDGTVVY